MIKFQINAIGKLKKSPTLELIGEYRNRMKNSLEIFEFDLKKSANLPIDGVMAKEAELLQSNLPKQSFVFAMDETGDLLTSHQFADLIQQKIERGFSSFAFIIGGAAGLDSSIRNNSDKVLALGKMTMPHMLARLILVEQLYRAECIMNNHPYDK